eukprot:3729006-Rhodomonas_salina.1
MSERANLIVKAGKGIRYENAALQTAIKAEDAPCDASFGMFMFIDFTCMHQAPFGTGEPEAFGAVLFNVGNLYRHVKTALWKLVDTPTEDPTKQYAERGWCFLEQTLACSRWHTCASTSP